MLADVDSTSECISETFCIAMPSSLSNFESKEWLDSLPVWLATAFGFRMRWLQSHGDTQDWVCAKSAPQCGIHLQHWQLWQSRVATLCIGAVREGGCLCPGWDGHHSGKKWWYSICIYIYPHTHIYKYTCTCIELYRYRNTNAEDVHLVFLYILNMFFGHAYKLESVFCMYIATFVSTLSTQWCWQQQLANLARSLVAWFINFQESLRPIKDQLADAVSSCLDAALCEA